MFEDFEGERKVSERKQTRAGNKRKASGGESRFLRRNVDVTVFTDVCCVCFGSYETILEMVTVQMWQVDPQRLCRL